MVATPRLSGKKQIGRASTEEELQAMRRVLPTRLLGKAPILIALLLAALDAVATQAPRPRVTWG